MLTVNPNPNTIQLFSSFKSPAPGRLLAVGGTLGSGILLVGFAVLVLGLPLAGMLSVRPHMTAKIWVLSGFGAIIVTVGIYLMGLKSRLEIDQRGIRYMRKRWSKITNLRAPISSLKAVGLKARVERSGKSTHVRYLIGLHIDALGFPDYLELGKFATEQVARSKAGELARAVNAPLQDCIGDQVIALDPNTGREIESALERQQERSAAASAGTRHFEITSMIGAKRANLYLALGAFLMFDLVIAIVVVAANVDLHTGFGLGMLAFVVVIPGLILVWFVLAWNTHQHISVNDSEVTACREWMGTRFMQRRIPVSDIRSVRGQTASADWRGVAIITDKRRWLLAGGASDETIAEIAQAIDQRF